MLVKESNSYKEKLEQIKEKEGKTSKQLEELRNERQLLEDEINSVKTTLAVNDVKYNEAQFLLEDERKAVVST